MPASKEVHLVKRPEAEPTADCFNVVETDVSDNLQEGQFLVKNSWMSVDPYMRPRMSLAKNYIPPFELNQCMDGGAVGEVVASNNDDFPVGMCVESFFGWRQYYVSNGQGVFPHELSPGVEPQHFLSALGMPGQTAYFGAVTLGQLAGDETVYVSGAAGMVGSIVCQIARNLGCKVIASAGSAEKVSWLKEKIGIESVFNYKEEATADALARLAPDGLDFYFDNVGGPQLEAALNNMADYGRIVCCGSISDYNSEFEDKYGVRSCFQIVVRKLKVFGLMVTEHYEHLPAFYSDMSTWIGEGKIVWEETVYEDIDKAPDAFIGMLNGANLGKMLVRL